MDINFSTMKNKNLKTEVKLLSGSPKSQPSSSHHLPPTPEWEKYHDSEELRQVKKLIIGHLNFEIRVQGFLELHAIYIGEGGCVQVKLCVGMNMQVHRVFLWTCGCTCMGVYPPQSLSLYFP